MARLFWVGVGAVGAVVLTRRLREQARRYTPEGVAERVEAAGEQAGLALTGAVRRFRAARAEREQELVDTLLVTPEGGDPHAVLRRGGRHRADEPRDEHDDDAWDGTPSSPDRTRPTGRVDPNEPLYDF